MHVLWLLTSRERLAEHRHFADRLMRELPASVSVKSFDDPASLKENGQGPVAVILSLPSSERGVPGVAAWAEVSLRAMENEATFRVFALDSPEPFAAMEEAGETPLSILCDAAQASSRETLPRALAEFLRSLPDIRDAALRRRQKSAIVRGSALLAKVLLLAAGAIVAGTLLSGASARSFLPNGVVTAVHAFAAAALFVVILAGRATKRRLDVEQTLALLCWGLVIWSISLRPFGPHAYVFLGLAGGLLAEHSRRAGARDEASLVRIEPTPSAPREERAVRAEVRAIVEGKLPPARAIPLFADARPRVFISYARRSVEGVETAHRLKSALAAAGIAAFVDRDIDEGSNWRRLLGQRFLAANVVISIADPVSVGRAWPAAELQAALDSNVLSGVPEIVLLRSATLRDEHVARARPVFRLALENGGQVSSLRVLSRGPETEKVLVAMLSRSFNPTKSVIRASQIRPLLVLGFPLIALLFLLGPLATVAGWPALALALADLSGGVSAAALLTAPAALGAGLLSAFWCGFLARLTVASRFEFVAPWLRRAYWAHGPMSVAFLWLAYRFLAGTSLANAWAVLIGVAAFWCAEAFTHVVGMERPELIRVLEPR